MKGATKELDPIVEVLPPREPDRDLVEEEAFEQLVEAFGKNLGYAQTFPEGAASATSYFPEFVREDEFTCRRCNLILHRSQLRDEEHSLCGGCSAQGSGRRGVGREPNHGSMD